MTDNTIKKAVLARVDDWQGLYVDGKLYTEGHRVDIFNELLGETVELVGVRNYIESDEQYTDDEGSFPQLLSELVEYERTWESAQDDD